MKNIVDIFVELGHRLASLTTSEGEGIITAAIEQNAWFTRPDIIRAIEAIQEEMLDADKLMAWYASYPHHYTQARGYRNGGQYSTCGIL